MNLRQLPNLITGLRMALVAPLLWCLDAGAYRWALGLALVAGGSDALDGWLAKRFDWRTPLGSLLDPVADKLLLAGSFIGLWLVEAVPEWLVALVIGRDVVIVAGAVAYHNLIGPVQGDPTRVSKATTVAQIALVLALLSGLAIAPLPAGVGLGMIAVVAALTIASGIDYVVRWGLRARRHFRDGSARLGRK
ncbi:MAG: CDP-alcohol phosphatidyltransferase family protein [Proteobacteria bacterium]|nr:CDP-alcohol phosphatidyltransferase family protein [Pseudomonadota bacterium]